MIIKNWHHILLEFNNHLKVINLYCTDCYSYTRTFLRFSNNFSWTFTENAQVTITLKPIQVEPFINNGYRKITITNHYRKNNKYFLHVPYFWLDWAIILSPWIQSLQNTLRFGAFMSEWCITILDRPHNWKLYFRNRKGSLEEYYNLKNIIK